MEEKKKTIIYVVISIGLLLSAVVGATFAYFRAQVGDGANVDINATTDTVDSLMFENEGDLTITASQANFNNSTDEQNNKSLMDSATVKANLKANSTTKTATKHYNVFLIIEYNDFEYTEDDEPELLLKLMGPNGETVYKTFTGLTYKDNITDRKGTKYEGYDITKVKHGVYKIISNQEISANGDETKTDTWKAELVFVNYDRDQNKNTGKSLRGSLYITTDEEFELPKIISATTTTTNNSLTINTNAINGTNKIDKYYYKVEETNKTNSIVKRIASTLPVGYQEATNTYEVEGLEENKNYEVTIVALDNKGYISNVYRTIVTIDGQTIPVIDNVESSATEDSITVTVTANGDNITNYYYQIDGGEWIDGTTTNSYTFNGLKDNTTHEIKIKVKDNNGKYSNEYDVEVTTKVKEKLEEKLLAYSKTSENTTTDLCPNGIGGLIKHDGSHIATENTENGAQTGDVLDANDDGYRYSGCNPNNFICFGPGSKNYNEGGENCPKENKYRIIGIVPVTKSDGSQEQLVKVIKSEYITASELGKEANDGTPHSNSSYTDKKRVEADVTKLDGFFWNLSSNTWTDGNYNYWSKADGEETKVATLNESLNNDKTGYLSKLKNRSDGIDWSDKIETVQWNVGGVNTNQFTPKAMKENEESDAMGGSITSKAKIGLMYNYDYGFASAKENWGSTVGSDYNSDANRSNNWLFNGVYEWTISRYSSRSYLAFYVDNFGGVYSYNVGYDYSNGVRPVFYLKSNVEIKSDGADGSSEHPFKVQ